MRTSFHHQPEAQHQKSPAIETPVGRLPHLRNPKLRLTRGFFFPARQRINHCGHGHAELVRIALSALNALEPHFADRK
jgi:hypothetical protein